MKRRTTLIGPGQVPPKQDAPKRSSASEARRRPEAIRVDEVGDVAVDMAARIDVRMKPRARALDGPTANALTAKEAYVLTLLDGRTSMDSLADIAPMTRDELDAVVARLRRLGLLTDR